MYIRINAYIYLRMNVHMYTFICMYILYMLTWVFILTCMDIDEHAYMHLSYIGTSIHACTHIRMPVYM